jgi:hypothetical protein
VPPGTARHDMTLFVLSIPLMMIMVALAVIPLIVMSRAEHGRMAAEARASDARRPEHVKARDVEPSLTVAA